MTEHDAMMAAILADPAADLPRLAYADWIEQYRQEVERAEFIRVQCELESMRLEPKPTGGQMTGGPRCRHTVPEKCSRCRDLIRRESDLWAYSASWFPGPYGLPICLPDLRNADFNPLGLVRRGFISDVSAPLAVLYGGEPGSGDGCPQCDPFSDQIPTHERRNCATPGILPRLVREQPVDVVRVTDREPMKDEGADLWMWFGGGGMAVDGRRIHPESDIPREIARIMRQEHGKELLMLKSREAADKALSDALFAWAKQQPV
jgi:uncharacterized protein (TIGR02996 family)